MTLEGNVQRTRLRVLQGVANRGMPCCLPRGKNLTHCLLPSGCDSPGAESWAQTM